MVTRSALYAEYVFCPCKTYFARLKTLVRDLKRVLNTNSLRALPFTRSGCNCLSAACACPPWRTHCLCLPAVANPRRRVTFGATTGTRARASWCTTWRSACPLSKPFKPSTLRWDRVKSHACPGFSLRFLFHRYTYCLKPVRSCALYFIIIIYFFKRLLAMCFF